MSGLLANIAFAYPAALWALLLLPAIWWLLRFTPPRPQSVRFPPLRLLLDLVSREEESDRTPWWLMLLRLALATLLILAVAQPALAPGQRLAGSSAPLLLVIDDGWAAAKDWNRRQDVIAELLAAAGKSGAPVILAPTTPHLQAPSLTAGDAQQALAEAGRLAPQALATDRLALLRRLEANYAASPALTIVWIADGIDAGSARAFADGLKTLAGGRAQVEALVPEASRLAMALMPPYSDGPILKLTARRPDAGLPLTIRALARAGDGRLLGDVGLTFAAAATQAEGVLDLPVELRNEIMRIDLDGERQAGAAFLFDDRWRRKSAAFLSGASLEVAQPLLSPLHYISRALEPYVEARAPNDAAALTPLLESGLSLLVVADVGILPEDTQAAIRTFVERGGVLLRFAGPRLAAGQDPLVPVRLRQGDRSLGSALSWEQPQPMQDFPAGSPFAGLTIDPTVKIARQVLAEPDAELPERTWATLADGTPLVTAARIGKGRIVLFHVTANPDWSNLPLSGLFVDMLRRVLDLAPAAGAAPAAAADGESTGQAAAFMPALALTGQGDLTDAAPEIRPIAAAAIDGARATAATPPGLYRRGAAERAINVSAPGDGLRAFPDLGGGIAVRGLAPAPTLALAPFAFAAAFGLFLLDCLAALFLGGGLARFAGRRAAAALALILALAPDRAAADEALTFAMRGALETHLAYVVTGNGDTDRISEEGLAGLGQILAERTSIEPAEPIGVNIERDELVFFPLIYWPVRADAEPPSAAALARIGAYMKNGGTIFFDLQDDGAGPDFLSDAPSPATEALRAILAKIDIPPLEPVPPDHVLGKSFYLMDTFPGRYDQGPLWVESGVGDEASDGVSSIIIGSNSYAAAWAFDVNRLPLYAVIPGTDRQRELAYRTGVNIVMYALTGNYKADQVHVPALLERLGQ